MKQIAHRGYSDKYPENTLLAFSKAIEKGFDGIETDVHKTKDGVLVLCHDEKIDRTSNGQGYIKDMTYDELLTYSFNYKNEGLDEKIPKLSQLLDLVKDKDVILDIEAKTDNIHYEGIEQDIYNLVKEYNLLDKCLFSSFYLDSLFKFREIDNTLTLGYLWEDNYEENKQKCIENNFNCHAKESLLDEDEIKIYESKGLEINTWTVKNTFRYNYFRELGVNMTISNKYFKDTAVVD
ncbi:MAG: glycerophosphodiester phosphodiesterase [Thomasclavelia sp.]|nr:glycerophosphodiester phosphodiesterase [Thomasclavelia sp.]